MGTVGPSASPLQTPCVHRRPLSRRSGSTGFALPDLAGGVSVRKAMSPPVHPAQSPAPARPGPLRPPRPTRTPGVQEPSQGAGAGVSAFPALIFVLGPHSFTWTRSGPDGSHGPSWSEPKTYSCHKSFGGTGWGVCTTSPHSSPTCHPDGEREGGQLPRPRPPKPSHPIAGRRGCRGQRDAPLRPDVRAMTVPEQGPRVQVPVALNLPTVSQVGCTPFTGGTEAQVTCGPARRGACGADRTPEPLETARGARASFHFDGAAWGPPWPVGVWCC